MRLLPTLAAVVVVATAAGCTAGELPGGATGLPPQPSTMAAIGDSITRAFAACGRGGDCAESSWATGTVEDVDSHAQRLGLGEGAAENLAVSGARVAGLADQVAAAIDAEPDYVTVLIGANDACAPDEAAMTPVEEYAAAFDEALDTLVRGLPDARILVLSIPDLARLWEIGADRPDVRRTWEAYGICQTMLADPTDTSAAAEARRERVRARVQDYNAAMAATCDRHTEQCRSDRFAVFDHRFDLADVSPLDFWHPSAQGQATLADVAWQAGFWS